MGAFPEQPCVFIFNYLYVPQNLRADQIHGRTMSTITVQAFEILHFWLTSSSVLVTGALAVLLWTIYPSFLNWLVLRHIPSPKGLPIFGHHLHLRKLVDDLPVIEEWSKEYGPVFRVRPLGWLLKEQVFISDPDDVKRVLVTNAHNYFKPDIMKKAMPNLGNGVFTSNGKEHARQRKLLNPVFNSHSLKAMFKSFQCKAEILAKVWSDYSDTTCKSGRVEQIQNDFARVTLDVIGDCAFGYEFDTIKDGNDEISSAFIAMLQDFNISGHLLKFIPILKHIPTTTKKKEDAAIKTIDEVILQVIQKKRQRSMKHEDEEENVKQDLLQLLLNNTSSGEQEQVMNDEELRAQVFTFLLAGNETTSVVMAWTMYHLATYPEIQQRVRDEINGVATGDVLTWDEVDSLKFLTAVINETLRLRPPVPIIARYAKTDDVLGGYKIPAGTPILISPYVIHRSSQFWNEPDRFNPDRFLSTDNQVTPSHRYAFLPFMHGPRMCIGYKFAMMEMKTVLAMLLRQFSFSFPPDVVFQASVQFTYKLTPALRLIVTKL